MSEDKDLKRIIANQELQRSSLNYNDLEVAEKLGALKSGIDSIDHKLDNHINKYDDYKKDVDAHISKVNQFLGKVGMITLAIGTVVATLSNVVIEWVKTHIMK